MPIRLSPEIIEQVGAYLAEHTDLTAREREVAIMMLNDEMAKGVRVLPGVAMKIDRYIEVVLEKDSPVAISIVEK